MRLRTTSAIVGVAFADQPRRRHGGCPGNLHRRTHPHSSRIADLPFPWTTGRYVASCHVLPLSLHNDATAGLNRLTGQPTSLFAHKKCDHIGNSIGRPSRLNGDIRIPMLRVSSSSTPVSVNP